MSLFSPEIDIASPVPLNADPKRVPTVEPSVSPIYNNPDLIGDPIYIFVYSSILSVLDLVFS